MTDQEFDVLDELYFVIAYDALKATLHYSDEEIQSCLKSLWNKGYIRCLANAQEEVLQPDFNKLTTYHFLASKAGLLAHNSR